MLRRRAVEEEKDARLGLTEMSGALPGRLRLSGEIVAQAQPERAQPADAQKFPARQTVAQAARRAEEAEHEGVPNARLCSIVPIPGRKEIEICVAATQYSSRDAFSRVKSLLHKAQSKCVARDADTHTLRDESARCARRNERKRGVFDGSTIECVAPAVQVIGPVQFATSWLFGAAEDQLQQIDLRLGSVDAVE